MKADEGPRRITRGDAEAVLHAFGGGGRTVLSHSTTAQGAPADVAGSRGAIRPFSGSPWDGAHFCAEDWHVVVVADIEGGDASFQHDDAVAVMDGLDVAFTLDGAALPTTRTAVKRFANPAPFGVQSAFWFQQGRVMAPDELGAGSHRLEVSMTDTSGQQTFADAITFTIDAPGTGTCV